jgi:uncharacterized protein (TIGR04255 family)
MVIAMAQVRGPVDRLQRISTDKEEGLKKEDSILKLPEVTRAQFKKNFIKTVVCELRFPALLEFESKPPFQLQKELRKEFPNYDRQQAFNVTNPEEKEVKHVLKSRKGDWWVAIKSYSIAVQTDRYTHFSEFSDKLKYVLDKSLPLLDTDFFTRVGLRYINEIHIEDGALEGWINDDLLAPIVHGIYGSVDRYIQEVRGSTKSGRFSFRHGIAGLEAGKKDIYQVDFDFYDENIQAEKVMPLAVEFNREAFRFFQWAIGPKARDRLGGPMTTGDK